ncbi:hypothetical protein RIF29_23139 [Crotalaria pallida]|uniref:SKP1-like protein n=1 Tax=Crotalaria pallida TaxID=3830 RepID=A0AAN9F9R1_CROPI
MASSSSMKKITLQTLQGDLFEVDEAFVNECKKIKHLIDGGYTKKVAFSLKIKSETLSKVIQYVNKHAEVGVTASKADKKNLKAWDAEFMKVDMDSLYDLITSQVASCDLEWLRRKESCRAASDLGHESLLNLACQTVAEKIKGNDYHMLREMFNIKNDFTPEEEEENQKMFDSIFCP